MTPPIPGSEVCRDGNEEWASSKWTLRRSGLIAAALTFGLIAAWALTLPGSAAASPAPARSPAPSPGVPDSHIGTTTPATPRLTPRAATSPYLATTVQATTALIPQTITLTSTPLNLPQVGQTYDISANGGDSGRPVTFSTTSPTCSLSESTVTFTHVGTCAVGADQTGTAGHRAAPTAVQSVEVNADAQTISFSSTPETATAGGASYQIAAVASSGLRVLFSTETPAVCTVDDSAVSFLTAGTCTVTALQDGDAHEQIATAEQTFSVRPAVTPGDVYIADTINGRVVELPAGGGPDFTVGTGWTGPTGLVVDAAGNLFVADYAGRKVVEIPAGGGQRTVAAAGLSSPNAVAVDGRGNVYIADFYANTVLEVPAGGERSTNLGTGLAGPLGVAADALGNVYIADAGHNRVVEVPADRSAQRTLGTAVDDPIGLAVDALGEVFVTEGNTGNVVEISVHHRAARIVMTGLSGPSGPAIDARGAVYVADVGHNRVVEIATDGTTDVLATETPLNTPYGTGVDASPPTFMAAAPPRAATVSVPYPAYTFAASTPAAEPAATYRVVAGSVPDGLTLDPHTGRLAGTPTRTGTFSFRVQVANAAVGSVTAPLTIVVGLIAQTITFTSTPPATPVVGAQYQVSASGGGSGQPVLFSLDAASTPGSCIVSSSGRVAFLGLGTCAVNAAQSGDAHHHRAATAAQKIVIATRAPAFPSTTRNLPNGIVGMPYSVVITETADPKAVNLISGAPPGLSLTGLTLSGVPRAAGTFTFSLTATNRGGSATSLFIVVIGAGISSPIPGTPAPPPTAAPDPPNLPAAALAITGLSIPIDATVAVAGAALMLGLGLSLGLGRSRPNPSGR